VIGTGFGDTFSIAEGLGAGMIFAMALFGQGGNDTLTGSSSADQLEGGDGADRVLGLGGNDFLAGDAGDDYIDGGAGVDQLRFSSFFGALTIDLGVATAQVTGQGTDTLIDIEDVLAGFGNDTVTGSAVANKLEGGSGADTLNGAGGADTLIGGAGDDHLNGGADDDVLTGYDGADIIDGGAGVDTATFTGLSSGYTWSWNRAVLTVSGADGTDSLTNVEKIQFSDTTFTFEPYGGEFIGGSSGEQLNGTDGRDELWGYGGDDVLVAGGSADLLVAGDGNDYAYGQGGADQIYAGAGHDVALEAPAVFDAEVRGFLRAQVWRDGAPLPGPAGIGWVRAWTPPRERRPHRWTPTSSPRSTAGGGRPTTSRSGRST